MTPNSRMMAYMQCSQTSWERLSQELSLLSSGGVMDATGIKQSLYSVTSV